MCSVDSTQTCPSTTWCKTTTDCPSTTNCPSKQTCIVPDELVRLHGLGTRESKRLWPLADANVRARRGGGDAGVWQWVGGHGDPFGGLGRRWGFGGGRGAHASHRARNDLRPDSERRASAAS
jgi:hypothetical protein